MFNRLAKLIIKRSWLIIILVLIVTIFFSTFIPSIEIKTEFEDFMPEEEAVKANDRITNYFGQKIPTLFLFVKTNEADSTLSIEAIREQYAIEQKLIKKPEINSSISLTTFIEQISLIEYGKSLNELTNQELEIVLDDLLSDKKTEEIKILKNDDENEEIDYTLFPKISKGKSKDSIDIKNGYAKYDNDDITFKIEVYDLSDINENLKPPINFVNTIEWYIEFENLITLHDSLDIDYKISAHIEPKHPLWVIGEGIIPNINNILNNIKQRELLNTYEKSVYLWIKPPGQEMYFPLPLKTGEINFNKQDNLIEIKISRKEIGNYGIATNISGFELPTKISNFKLGSRYYRNTIGLPGNRIYANTSYLFEKIKNIQNKPTLRNIADKLFQKYGDISYEEFLELLPTIEKNIPLSDKISLKDIESSWIITDTTENNEENLLFIKPNFYDDLKISTESFVSISKHNSKPQASLIILQLNRTGSYEEILVETDEILDYINTFDKEKQSISIEVTGERVVTKDINRITTESNQFIAPAIFIIIVVILYLNFRKLSYVVLPMITLLISTIWLFGTLVFIGMSFSVMQVALIPLVLGLGVDYSVHLFHNYKAELEKGKTSAEAIKTSVLEVGNAMFLAMLTTVIAFMSFLSSSVPALKDFGLLLGLGVSYTFITAITILPTLRYILDKKKEKKQIKKQNNFNVSFFMRKVSNFVLKYNKIIAVIMIMLSIVFVIGGSQIETGFDLDEFAPEDTPSIELFDKIYVNFPYSSQDQEFILIEGEIATVKALEGIAQTHKNFEDDPFIAKNPDGSLKTISVYTVIQNVIKTNNSIIEKFNINKQTGIPRSDNDVKKLFDYLYEKEMISFEQINMQNINIQEIQNQSFNIDTSGAEIKNVLHKKDSRYDATIIRVYIIGATDEEDRKVEELLGILKNDLENDIVDYGNAEAIVTGSYIINLSITESLTDSQVISTALSLILAAIVLIIAYRNPLLGLIAMIPVGITMIWILGTMYFIGYSLNALTITITSITIGIGIDYSIHATERFKLVADRTGDINKAMCETISHTGGALLIAALTTACGFGILALAPMPPQQQFGVILSITIIFSLLTSILILPSILVFWAKRRKKIKGYIVTTNGLKKENGKWKKEKPEEKNEKSCEK